MTIEQIKKEYDETRDKDYAWLNAIEALQTHLGYATIEAERLVETWDEEHPAR